VAGCRRKPALAPSGSPTTPARAISSSRVLHRRIQRDSGDPVGPGAPRQRRCARLPLGGDGMDCMEGGLPGAARPALVRTPGLARVPATGVLLAVALGNNFGAAMVSSSPSGCQRSDGKRRRPGLASGKAAAREWDHPPARAALKSRLAAPELVRERKMGNPWPPRGQSPRSLQRARGAARSGLKCRCGRLYRTLSAITI
jgi:hypothetical protein